MRWGHRSSSGLAGQATQRLLRVMLLVSLWDAPLPWINVHGALSPRSGAANSLSLHFARFHADACLTDETNPGWHVHFVMPWSVSEEGPCPADGRHHDSQELTAAAVQSGRQSGSDLPLDTDCVSLERSATPVDVLASFEAHRSRRPAASQTERFLQAGSVSLCTLICVARC